jgi:hypothetical protein
LLLLGWVEKKMKEPSWKEDKDLGVQELWDKKKWFTAYLDMDSLLPASSKKVLEVSSTSHGFTPVDLCSRASSKNNTFAFSAFFPPFPTPTCPNLALSITSPKKLLRVLHLQMSEDTFVCSF